MNSQRIEIHAYLDFFVMSSEFETSLTAMQSR